MSIIKPTLPVPYEQINIAGTPGNINESYGLLSSGTASSDNIRFEGINRNHLKHTDMNNSFDTRTRNWNQQEGVISGTTWDVLDEWDLDTPLGNRTVFRFGLEVRVRSGISQRDEGTAREMAQQIMYLQVRGITDFSSGGGTPDVPVAYTPIFGYGNIDRGAWSRGTWVDANYAQVNYYDTFTLTNIHIATAPVTLQKLELRYKFDSTLANMNIQSLRWWYYKGVW